AHRFSDELDRELQLRRRRGGDDVLVSDGNSCRGGHREPPRQINRWLFQIRRYLGSSPSTRRLFFTENTPGTRFAAMYARFRSLLPETTPSNVTCPRSTTM